jgi:hypothetical protein
MGARISYFATAPNTAVLPTQLSIQMVLGGLSLAQSLTTFLHRESRLAKGYAIKFTIDLLLKLGLSRTEKAKTSTKFKISQGYCI